ncbi:MAG: HAD family hydrolase, partial [Planctomycetaceae bacterium]|nr:HAD family hydrolase [Planctomycetaceae bacterium]
MDRRQLVVSDLDGTLLGDDAALAQFARWYERARSRVALVYASGRFDASVRASVAATDLPEPDAIIGGVGTEIRCFRTGRELVDWPAVLPTLAPPHWDAAAVRRSLAEFPRLTLQPDEFQAGRKVSYFLMDATADELTAIDALLRHFHLACEIVYSSREHLDVLPRGINKGTAARQLADAWRIGADSVIVCGDTANDLALFQQGFRGVVVANAHDELKQLA